MACHDYSLSWAAVAEPSNTWERVAGLPLQIEAMRCEPLQALVSSEFERKSTVIRMAGAGQEGIGEDVTYDAVDQEILQAAGAEPAARGELDDRLVLRAHRVARPVSRGAPARGVAALSRVGI